MKLLIAFFGLMVASAHAEIYKSIDENGHVTYSNIPSKGAKRLDVGPSRSEPSREGDLKVDGRTQKMRDRTRHKILEEELNAEKSRLEKSRKEALGEKSDPIAAKKSREDVILHEKNIEALEREISNLK